MSNTNVEQNQSRGRVVDDYILDREPQKELLLREALDSDEAAVGEVGSDDLVVENPSFELGEARPLEVDLEEAAVVEVVGFHDALGEEARREAFALEQLMNGGGS